MSILLYCAVLDRATIEYLWEVVEERVDDERPDLRSSSAPCEKE